MKKIIVIFSMVCFAFGMTGNVLYEYGMKYDDCLDNKSCNQEVLFHAGVYLGYIGGVFNAYEGIIICPPKNFDSRQLLDIVFKYLKNHPEDRNLDGNIIIIKALESWKCNLKTKK